MKRTKRYGGFLVGDRVKDKRSGYVGTVVDMQHGRLIVKDAPEYAFTLMPNQLINLTRHNEDVKASIKVLKDHINWLNENGFPIDFTPTIESLGTQERVIAFSPSDLPKSAYEDML